MFVGIHGSLAADRSAAKEPYDIVIINGRVVDGSGNPWFYADLGIKGGKIVKNRQNRRRKPASA